MLSFMDRNRRYISNPKPQGKCRIINCFSNKFKDTTNFTMVRILGWDWRTIKVMSMIILMKKM